MRVLKFIINGLKLTKDPQCDFSGIVPGTKGYLKAEFKFNEDWYTCKKMAVFSVPGSQDDEILTFKSLHTNYVNTKIFNDSGAYMKVAYAADTKIYIDNKFAELQSVITGES